MARNCRSHSFDSGEGGKSGSSRRWSPKGYPLLIILYSAVLVTTATAASRISQVRAGDHQDFARLVFEMEGTAQIVHPEVSPGTIRLSFSDTETQLPKRQVLEGPIRSIEFESEGPHLNAAIEVAAIDFETRLFSLDSPTRVVLDVVPKQGNAALGTVSSNDLPIGEPQTVFHSNEKEVADQGVESVTGLEPQAEDSTVFAADGQETLADRNVELIPTEKVAGGLETGRFLPNGFYWARAGVFAFGLFLIGLISVVCMTLVKGPGSRGEKAGSGEEFRKSVAEIDRLIAKEVRNYEKLRWRKQE